MSMQDPFQHHPKLRGKITDPADSFFRDLTLDKIRALAEEHGMPVDWWYTDEEREAMRQTDLAGRMDQDLWIFGYGSLMWDPGVYFTEVRRARVDGLARRFILKEVNGGRGNAECPGLMAALDTGDGCDGLVFRLAAEDLECETRMLWQREVIAPGYKVKFLTAQTICGPVEVMTFVADHDAAQIAADIDRDTQIECVAKASGILGSSLEYLQNVAVKLRELDIHDEDVESLLRDAEAYAATMDG